MGAAGGVGTAETIARYAEFSELPLLVMGTRGESGLRRMVTGSVASGCKLDNLKGKVKDALGRLTGNTGMQGEGKVDG